MVFWLSYMSAMKEIFSAPFRNTNILWQLAPVLILWIIIDIYLDTHKQEKLGWNTALGNSISLSWITLASLQQLFASKKLAIYGNSYFTWSVFFLLSFFLVYAVFIAYVSFKHMFSGKVTYILAYPTIVYFLSMSAILFGSGAIMPNKWIFLALFSIWAIIVLLKSLLWWLLPESSNDSE